MSAPLHVVYPVKRHRCPNGDSPFFFHARARTKTQSPVHSCAASDGDAQHRGAL